MFQYAFARSLALRNGTSLRMSRYYFRDDYFKRVYALHNLNISNDISLMTHTQENVSIIKFRTLKRIYGLLTKDKRNFFSRGIIIFDEYDRYEPEFMRPGFIKGNIIVLGYFQTCKYFSDFDEQIKRELRVRTPPSAQNAVIIKELESCESVCVHVRRGDYLKVDFGNVCGYEYYERAIRFISERVADPVFYFFSNDHSEIEWLKTNWNFPGVNVKYIDLNNPDYEELRLMYSCKHFIIANSSFSWWGSYLSDNPGKIICAPSSWVDERPIEETNIFVPGWKIISNERDD
ncbi:MAG: alpha-1,2-fucosyltransferase [Synergistaceae bacterium]|nr:alpha-1,2-fucosyltransferase [Synergistaceae bacterium]